jgi:hypothetical protein
MQGCPEWRAGYFIYYSIALRPTQIVVRLKVLSIAGDIYAN